MMVERRTTCAVNVQPSDSTTFIICHLLFTSCTATSLCQCRRGRRRGALAQEARDRLAAQVHVGLRLDQLDGAPLDLRAPDERTALRAPDRRVRLPRQQVNEHEAEVVARPLVALARIAKPDD